jgi:thiol-disulfide isomerase/thioredoxin
MKNFTAAWGAKFRSLLICCWAILLCCSLAAPAWAGLDDDRFDGNIFVLYAGNGSLVPPRINLADSLSNHKPAMLVFYADDSKDCKRFAGVVSQLQADYGRASNFIPVSIDSLNQQQYASNEAGFYYKGKIPQTIILNENGKVVYEAIGNASFNDIDNAFRKVFNRPPREAKDNLEQRSFNEFNSELGK